MENNNQLNVQEEKKEVQKKIIEIKDIINENKATEDEFMTILRLVAPGTNLRAALEGILKIGRGALIVVENDFTNSILDGGFKLNCRFTPQRLMELSKMDGAMILSKDMKKIMHANVLLTPDNKIQSNETGTRHKAAERTAKMTGTLVIAISERKNETHIYYKNIKYHLRDAGDVLRRTTWTLQMLEKQRELFDQHLAKLNEMEIENEIQFAQACKVLQKGEAMQRILKSIEKNLIELGNEAHAIKGRIKEIMKDINEETNLIIRDYTSLNTKKTRSLLETLNYDEIIDINNIVTALAQKETNVFDSIKGWRILSKTGISEQEASFLIKELGSLNKILDAEEEIYKKILGEEKSELFSKAIRKIKNGSI